MIIQRTHIAVGLLASMYAASAANAQVEILALEDSPVHGFVGEFYDNFGAPVIDDTGSVFFLACWGASTADGGLMTTQNNSVSLLLQEDVPSAGLSFTPFRFADVAVSSTGLEAGVAVLAAVRGGFATTDAIVLIQPHGVTRVHHDGEPVPVGIGVGFVRDNMNLAMSPNGHLAYSVLLEDTPGGAIDDRAIYQYNSAQGAYSSVVQQGDLFPDGSGTFEGICGGSLDLMCTPHLNASGETAFIANGGIFVNDGNTTRTVVRFGQSIGSDTVHELSFPRINIHGDVAFSAETSPTSFNDVFIESNGVLTRAILGDTPTTAGGVLGTFRTPMTPRVRFNDRREVCFGMLTTEQSPTGVNRTGEGLFVFNGTTTVSVGRRYEQAPGGGEYRTMYNSDSWMINNEGQVLFKAGVDIDGNNNRETLFLYTPGEGTERILAIGDVVEGRVVTNIYEIDSGFSAAGSLNDRGEVVIKAGLDDGLEAVLLIGGQSACVADITGDGSLNFFDVSAFLQAFNAEEPIADFTGDGNWNFFDVSAYLVAFSNGCP